MYPEHDIKMALINATCPNGAFTAEHEIGKAQNLLKMYEADLPAESVAEWKAKIAETAEKTGVKL